MTKGISRRAFVKTAAVTGVAALAGACGDDGATSRRDTADGAPDLGPDTTTADASDTLAPDAPDTTSVKDAPDVAETTTGPTPIGVFDPKTAAESLADFPFGVQAGDPDREGAVLWTHYEGAEALDLVLFADGAEGEPGDLYLREPATPNAAGFVHLTVSGLATDTRYRYAFLAVGAGGALVSRSRVGRFRTAPDERRLRVVTFGGTSCVNQDYRPYRTLSRAAEADLDFFVMSGDGAYMDDAESLADYRALWREALDTDGYRGLLGSTGIFNTWDDHEVHDNWDPEHVDPEVLGWAQTTYLDHVALRLDPSASGWKIWRRQRWGRTLELFVLDCRSERKPSTRFTDDPIYISRAQMDWLKRGLRDSPCVFKVIVNTVPITDMPSTYPAEKDRWEGYIPQRNEILNHVLGPPGVPGTLWISGDFHFGAIARVDPPGGKFNSIWEVFMGQGANMANPVWSALGDVPAQFPFLTGTNNFVKFICDPHADPPVITAVFIDGDGKELVRQELQVGARKVDPGGLP
ncbi:MAG: alkaline phosphatase D family protein [Deltaproteobacteria bacterium]|nr:alkaline phosphatase D family protein [Deltaproteobacteria bacterium]